MIAWFLMAIVGIALGAALNALGCGRLSSLFLSTVILTWLTVDVAMRGDSGEKFIGLIVFISIVVYSSSAFLGCYLYDALGRKR
jgi:hypothetical protein